MEKIRSPFAGISHKNSDRMKLDLIRKMVFTECFSTSMHLNNFAIFYHELKRNPSLRNICGFGAKRNYCENASQHDEIETERS